MEIGRVTPILFTLAFRNLFQDRVRLIVTLVGIVFSVVLFTVELGLFFGFQRTVTIMIDHASADLWIAPAETKSFEATALLDGRERFRALAVPGVAEVTPVLIGFTYWRKPDGKSSTPVFLIGSQLGAGGLQPWNLIEGSISDLAKPQAVAIDRSYFDRLGVSELGDSAEIGDQKARVAAVTKGIRSFTTTPYVFTSLDRARSYINAPPSSATYFTVRVAPGANVDDVRRQLASALPNLEIITSDQFRQRSRSYWLFGTGAGAALFGSAILGIIVGTVIVAQTLYSSTKDHLSEFATLRAMGSSRPFLYKVIVWQALMTAVIGFAIAASIGLIVARVSTDTALPIILPARADRRPVRAHRRDEHRLRVLGHAGCDARRSGYGPGPMSEPLIEAKDIVKYLGTGPGQVQALRGVTLSVSGGELVLLMGPSGSGKTTLLTVLGCMLTPNSGTVRIRGQSTQGLRPEQLTDLRRQHIGFIFQTYHLFPTLTAVENVRLALEMGGERPWKAQARAVTALETVSLGHKVNSFPRQLSSGEQQRVAIARAIVSKPAAILADEPTAALDSANGHAIMSVLANVAKDPAHAVLVVTHDPRVIPFADRILHMEDGRLVEKEQSAQILRLHERS